MDNAKIHHGQEILDLVAEFGTHMHMHCFCAVLIANVSTGVQIEYLPPYSPDLNPIEEAFSKIKHWIRHHQDFYKAAEGNAIFFDMWEVLEIIMPKAISFMQVISECNSSLLL